jgi:sugar lactone lactonase YvrE
MKILLLLLAALVCFNSINAQEAFEIREQVNLIPEGIAINPGNETIYISSIAQKKIIQIKKDKTSSDFISKGQDGFLEGLGMKVDTARNLLWALSNSRNEDLYTSQVHAFDLISGKNKHRYTLTDSTPHLFNDLVIDPSGNLLITDTYSSTVYSFHPLQKKLEVLIRDSVELKWPNGIEFLDSEHLVLATYGKGLLRIHLPTKSIRALEGYKGRLLAFGLDGLVMNEHHLYGVYNAGRGGYPSNAIVQYTLDEKNERIVSEKIIDKGNPAFADPTTAAKLGKKLYVIANSHLDQYNANKEKVDGIEMDLKPLRIVVYGM